MEGELIGHSGCELKLIGGMVVKVSSNLDYNDRLSLQCEKQKNFKSKYLFTPKIVDLNYSNNGLFNFSMEYVRGYSFCDYIINKPLIESFKILDQILEYLKLNLIKSKSFVSNEIIRSKLFAINKTENIDSQIINFITKNIDHLNIKKGYCHGDLTFENIMISKESVYLIDFLDSYINSPLQDISKLYQDFNMLWSFRNKNSSAIVDIRVKELEKYLDKTLGLSENDRLVVDILLIMNFLRILPYSKDINLKNNLTRNILKIIKKWK
tara:strand:+ start:809 stop:1609 length:801 start_codon:yes stop_codon:yes gene_type:complete